MENGTLTRAIDLIITELGEETEVFILAVKNGELFLAGNMDPTILHSALMQSLQVCGFRVAVVSGGIAPNAKEN